MLFKWKSYLYSAPFPEALHMYYSVKIICLRENVGNITFNIAW